MKKALNILFVRNRAPNPFIRILAEGITTDYFHVDSGVNPFWDLNREYDILQIHWPEFFFYSNKKNLPTKEFGERLYDTLQKRKKAGTKIVYTMHDETTHYVESRDVRTNLYEIIESNADAMVHLGNFSKNKMNKSESINCPIQAVIPHHIYDTFYPRSVSREEARNVLGIEEKFKVILTFGTYRNEEENLLVKNAFEQLNVPEKFLLAPAWYHDGWHEYKNNRITLTGNCMLGQGTVENKMLPYYFTAADVVFIHRLHNLNSGNLPMGFYYNKTVVAPAIGNLTEYIDNVNNFSFNPHDPSSVLSGLKKGIERSSYPQENEVYAREQWNTAKTCELYKQLYLQLTQ